MSIGKSSIARAAVANSATAAKAQNNIKENSVITKFSTDEIKVLAVADATNDAELTTLKESINKRGILVPVLIAVTPKNEAWLIDGYRRFYAAKALGLAHIDAVIINAENKNEINRLYKEIKSAKSVQKTDNIHEEKFKVLAVVDHDLPPYLL